MRYHRVFSVLLVCLLVCGCAAPNEQTEPTEQTDPTYQTGIYTDVLTEERKLQIEQALAKENSPIVGDWYSEENKNGVRYYGTYNGYDILFGYGELSLTAFSAVSAAGIAFVNPQSFQLLAHKDGQLYSLQSLYELGMLTREDIEKMHDIHVEYQKNRYSYEYDW